MFSFSFYSSSPCPSFTHNHLLFTNLQVNFNYNITYINKINSLGILIVFYYQYKFHICVWQLLQSIYVLSSINNRISISYVWYLKCNYKLRRVHCDKKKRESCQKLIIFLIFLCILKLKTIVRIDKRQYLYNLTLSI